MMKKVLQDHKDHHIFLHCVHLTCLVLKCCPGIDLNPKTTVMGSGRRDYNVRIFSSLDVIKLILFISKVAS